MYKGLYKTPNKALSCLVLSCLYKSDRSVAKVTVMERFNRTFSYLLTFQGS